MVAAAPTTLYCHSVLLCYSVFCVPQQRYTWILSWKRHCLLGHMQGFRKQLLFADSVNANVYKILYQASLNALCDVIRLVNIGGYSPLSPLSPVPMPMT